jgi:two-component system NtrC family response regulator
MGAFTGAKKQKRGLIEMADKGTLFLDEISSMAPNLQAKLLRVLEARTFTRLGNTGETKVDLRLLSASNRDLARLIEAGQFREDLYFRISVVRLDLPPLRERIADLPLFVAHFLAHFNRETGRAITGVARAPDARRPPCPAISASWQRHRARRSVLRRPADRTSAPATGCGGRC